MKKAIVIILAILMYLPLTPYNTRACGTIEMFSSLYFTSKQKIECKEAALNGLMCVSGIETRMKDPEAVRMLGLVFRDAKFSLADKYNLDILFSRYIHYDYNSVIIDIMSPDYRLTERDNDLVEKMRHVYTVDSCDNYYNAIPKRICARQENIVVEISRLGGINLSTHGSLGKAAEIKEHALQMFWKHEIIYGPDRNVEYDSLKYGLLRELWTTSRLVAENQILGLQAIIHYPATGWAPIQSMRNQDFFLWCLEELSKENMLHKQQVSDYLTNFRLSHPIHHQSDGILLLQEALVSKGYKIKVDGILGKNTIAAMNEFQTQHNIKKSFFPEEATLKSLHIDPVLFREKTINKDINELSPQQAAGYHVGSSVKIR